MEHQSATAYGNDFQNGYLGDDHSQSMWGNKFDHLIIHESGHEWFACNITCKDVANIWIHESFTTYSEGLIGNYGVNDLAYSGDNYPKGATVLHMLRQLVNDDEKWRQILRGLNNHFYHQTVTTQQIENYIAEKTGLDLKYFWDQYLRTTQIPVFEYYFANNRLSYRWINSIEDFDMPLKINVNDKEEWIYPTTQWQEKKLDADGMTLKVDRNFYVPSFYSNSH